MIKLVILGQPVSKANSRQIVMFGNRPASIKSRAAREYARSAALQVPRISHLLTGPLRATMRLYYASERPDLDPSLVLDVLQGRVYQNDRQVREMHLYHGVDKVNPRAEIEVEPLEPGLFPLEALPDEPDEQENNDGRPPF